MDLETNKEFLNFCISNKSEEIYTINHVDFELKLNFTLEESVLCINEKFVPNYVKFYNFVYNDFKKKKKYFILENQKNVSGIMLDFDIYRGQDTKDVLTPISAPKISEIIIKTIKNFIDLPNDLQIFIFVLGHNKPEKVKKEIKEKTKEVLKEGFHFQIPGIKISKETKTKLYKIINKDLELFFGKKDVIHEFDYLDVNSCDVPIEVYGTIRPSKKSAIKILYTYIYKNNEFEMFDLPDDFNPCLELSLIYDGKYVKKQEYKTIQAEFVNNNDNTEYKIVTETARTIKSFERLCETDPTAELLRDYLNLLDKKRGLYVRNSGLKSSWMSVCRAILSVDRDYIPIAEIFLKSCNGELTISMKNAIKKINVNVDKESREICFNQIKGWAKKDNPKLYEDIKSKSLQTRIKNLLRISVIDTICETDIAKIIGIVYSGKIYFVPEESFSRATSGVVNGYWLFYVTEQKAKTNKCYEPFIYKYYKTYDIPIELDEMISGEFRDELLKIYNERENFAKEQDKLKENAGYLKKVSKAHNFCGTQQGIIKITSRLKSNYLSCKNIAFELDANVNNTSVLGVGNGILSFKGKEVELHQGLSPYKISRTTKTPFIEYDELKNEANELESLLDDIFPIELEKECVLMALSQCLVRDSPTRYMHLWISDGSSGKSLLCFLMHNALGLKNDSLYGENYGYSYKISPDVFMKDKSDPNGADSHLANLNGMHFISASEGSSKSFKTHIFKRLKDDMTYRQLYQETKICKFPGAIIIPFNHEPEMDKQDYGFSRRIMFVKFRAKFVPKSKLEEFKENKYVKIENPKFLEKAKNSKRYAKVWLSILVKYWKKLQEEYNGVIDDIMIKSGIMEQTKEFILRHDYISVFIEMFIIKKEGAKVKVQEFCVVYANWLKKQFGESDKAPSYNSSVMGSSLGNKVKTEKGIAYIYDHVIIENDSIDGMVNIDNY